MRVAISESMVVDIEGIKSKYKRKKYYHDICIDAKEGTININKYLEDSEDEEYERHVEIDITKLFDLLTKNKFFPMSVKRKR